MENKQEILALSANMYEKALSIVQTKIRGGASAPFFKQPYMDAAFSDNIFLWDTCFMASYAKYHRDLPIEQALDNFYNLQDEDGHICREYAIDGKPVWLKKHPVSVNPPLLAFAELELFSQSNDIARLRRVYPALRRWFLYLIKTYQQDDGLFFGDALGMGMDNITRFPVGWIDDGEGVKVTQAEHQSNVAAGGVSGVYAGTYYERPSARFNKQGRLIDFSALMALFAHNLHTIAARLRAEAELEIKTHTTAANTSSDSSAGQQADTKADESGLDAFADMESFEIVGDERPGDDDDDDLDSQIAAAAADMGAATTAATSATSSSSSPTAVSTSSSTSTPSVTVEQHQKTNNDDTGVDGVESKTASPTQNHPATASSSTSSSSSSSPPSALDAAELLCSELDHHMIGYLGQHAAIEQAINAYCWSEKDGFYFDLAYGRHRRKFHIGSYWVLLARLVPAHRLDRFVAHLSDTKKFARATPVPSLAADEADYVGYGRYWQGGVWAPTTYMVLRGLRAVGQEQLAVSIAWRFYGAVAHVFKHTGTFWENYAPDLHSYGHPAKPDFCGWTALAPIAVYREFIASSSSTAPTTTASSSPSNDHKIDAYEDDGGGFDDIAAPSSSTSTVSSTSQSSSASSASSSPSTFSSPTKTSVAHTITQSWLLAFEFVDAPTLCCVVAAVSRAWSKLASAQSLWQAACARQLDLAFGDPELARLLAADADVFNADYKLMFCRGRSPRTDGLYVCDNASRATPTQLATAALRFMKNGQVLMTLVPNHNVDVGDHDAVAVADPPPLPVQLTPEYAGRHAGLVPVALTEQRANVVRFTGRFDDVAVACRCVIADNRRSLTATIRYSLHAPLAAEWCYSFVLIPEWM